MGLFGKLFGKGKNESASEALNTKYNIMYDISLGKCDKYQDPTLFESVGNEIYKDLNDEGDDCFRMTISYKLDSEDTQYPLEDVLNKYFLYVSDFLESENTQNSNSRKIELGGTLEDVKKAHEVIGKEVFNADFRDEDGSVRVDLVIK